MNKTDLAQIFAIFGVTGAVLMSAVAYLIKSLISHYLNKDFESYKIKLLEVSERGKLQYSILQERRALIISKFYSLLAKFENSIKDLMAPFQPAGTPSESEKMKIAAKDGNDFRNYYLENKIYFDKETCIIIDELNEKFRVTWIDFQYKDKIHREKEGDLWIKSWTALTEEIPLIKERIEDTFRDILGIESCNKK